MTGTRSDDDPRRNADDHQDGERPCKRTDNAAKGIVDVWLFPIRGQVARTANQACACIRSAGVQVLRGRATCGSSHGTQAWSTNQLLSPVLATLISTGHLQDRLPTSQIHSRSDDLGYA